MTGKFDYIFSKKKFLIPLLMVLVFTGMAASQSALSLNGGDLDLNNNTIQNVSNITTGGSGTDGVTFWNSDTSRKIVGVTEAGASDGQLNMKQGVPTVYGDISSQGYSHVYDGGKFRFSTTDGDGQGTNTDLMEVKDGTSNVRFLQNTSIDDKGELRWEDSNGNKIVGMEEAFNGGGIGFSDANGNPIFTIIGSVDPSLFMGRGNSIIYGVNGGIRYQTVHDKSNTQFEFTTSDDGTGSSAKIFTIPDESQNFSFGDGAKAQIETSSNFPDNTLQFGDNQEFALGYNLSNEFAIVDDSGASPSPVLKIPNGSQTVNVLGDVQDNGVNLTKDPGTTSTSSPGFGTWNTVDSGRPGFVVIETTVETDGTDPGKIDVLVDEDGDNTQEYNITVAEIPPDNSGGTDKEGSNGHIYVPAGGQYQVANVSDPNNANTIEFVREGVR